MYPNGRTMSEAIAAGDWYRISLPGTRFEYDPPACGSPEEVVACARQRFGAAVRDDHVFDVVRYLPGSQIGYGPTGGRHWPGETMVWDATLPGPPCSDVSGAWVVQKGNG